MKQKKAVRPARIEFIIPAVLLLIFSLTGIVPAQTGRVYPWQYFWQRSLAAYGQKDYRAFLENAGKAVETGPPNHPTLFYNLARAYSLTGDRREAATWLEKTLDLGFGIEAMTGDDFIFLRGTEYPELQKRLRRAATPIVKSETARTVLEPDLIPESLAYDRKTGALYVGSMYKRKIVRLDRNGRVRDFVTEGTDGLGSVVGIKIDEKRNALWILNNIAPRMKNFDKSRDGSGMLHRYHLDTGRLVKKYELAAAPRPHLLNDLVISRNGDLYITDSLSSVVHVLRSDADELKIFAELAPFSYPNGIALAGDESRLYVANLNGVAVIDVKTGKSTPLIGENTALAGIDGLYLYQNSLLAIQNFELPNRVARFHLDKSGARVTRTEILEANHPLYRIPTTGALVGRDFYYIANSQLRSFDENDELLPRERLQNVVILKFKLPPSSR